MLCGPSASSAVGVRMVLPLPSVETVAGTCTPSTSSTGVLPAGTVPILKSGVASLVRLAVLLVPLSVAAVMSGALVGAAGAVVSMVTGSAVLAGLVLPAVSTVWMAMSCVPSGSGVLGVMAPVAGS